MVKSVQFLCLIVLLGLGCNAPETPKSNNRYSDPKLQRIYELQDQQATRKLIPLLKSKKTIHREAAVLAFASIQDSFAVQFLRESLLTDSKINVRQAAAFSIGQMRDSTNVPTLFMALANEISSPSRKYILDALGKSANQKVVDYFNTFHTTVTQLREGHARGMYRAIYQRQVGDSFAKQCIRYFDIASSDETKFYAACVLARLPKALTTPYLNEIKGLAGKNPDGEVGRLLKTIIEPQPQASNRLDWRVIMDNLERYKTKPYDLVNDLRHTDLSSREAILALKDWSFNHRYQVVRTTAAELYLKTVEHNPDTNLNADRINYLERCIKTRDMALQSLACYEIVKHPDQKWMTLLRQYQDSLAMPRQIETYLDIEKAFAKIKDRRFVQLPVTYNHSIDWSHVSQIPDNQRVQINTTKGLIVVQLNVNEAPGSVSNFLKQVDSDFYTDKYFHRVVPNFVIQVGCVRGDGWGSPDWTQRSELSNYLTYDTGAVGLASGGKDTEGVQFFITHNPTPFLDGRYTIFGHVISGMDVVHAMTVGDKIENIIKVVPSEL
ncbi:MAG: cyclophilin family peptidyl-prolyl cis-trans isomerase [Bacteroidia bacterium]|jgi:cyclophilin family peptidyl-prolyl cis-trans isomerase